MCACMCKRRKEDCCFLKYDHEMMILATFRLLFSLATKRSFLFSYFSLVFFFLCFIRLYTVPCVRGCAFVSVSVLRTSCLFFLLQDFLLSLSDHRVRWTQKNLKNRGKILCFFLLHLYFVFFHCSICIQETHIHTHKWRTNLSE